MNFKFETVACSLCGEANHKHLLYAPDRFNPTGEYPFRIVQCLNCSFVFLNPRPTVETIAAFYKNQTYQPFISAQKQRSLWDILYKFVRGRALRFKRKKIERLKSPGFLLDIGCGTGEFLNEMQQHGWQVVGVEKDANAASFARKTYGLSVDTHELQDCKFEESRFDIITLWHVLEHVYHPLVTLRNVKSLLKDDGFILIAMPNIDSPDARFYRQDWVALDTPRHLLHFTPNSMRKACSDLGLELISVQQMILDAFYNCILSEQLRLKMKRRTNFLLPLFFLRAKVIALITIINAFGIWHSPARQGSSNLYICKKA